MVILPIHSASRLHRQEPTDILLRNNSICDIRFHQRHFQNPTPVQTAEEHQQVHLQVPQKHMVLLQVLRHPSRPHSGNHQRLDHP